MIPFPAPAPGAELRVSATLFLTHRRCPAQAMARLDGHYPEDTRRSFTGALVHRLIKRHFDQGPISDAALEQACRQEIGEGLNAKMASIGVNRPSALRPLLEEAGALYRRFRSFPDEGFDGAEVELEAVPAEGLHLVGKVDAVFREGRSPVLVDWKTGGLGDPESQLGFYALLWALERSEVPERVEAVSLQTGERFAREPDTRFLASLATDVSEMASEVRRGWQDRSTIPATGGPWCRYCPVLEGCPEGGAAVRVLDGSSTEESV